MFWISTVALFTVFFQVIKSYDYESMRFLIAKLSNWNTLWNAEGVWFQKHLGGLGFEDIWVGVLGDSCFFFGGGEVDLMHLIQQQGCSLDIIFLTGKYTAKVMCFFLLSQIPIHKQIAIWDSGFPKKEVKRYKNYQTWMLKTWESGTGNYFIAEPRWMRVWVVPQGFVMILTPLSSLGPLDMYPVEPQSTRGGVLLVDIAFNRPTAQNLHVRGLVWCRATRGDGEGMRKEHSNPEYGHSLKTH